MLCLEAAALCLLYFLFLNCILEQTCKHLWVRCTFLCYSKHTWYSLNGNHHPKPWFQKSMQCHKWRMIRLRWQIKGKSRFILKCCELKLLCVFFWTVTNIQTLRRNEKQQSCYQAECFVTSSMELRPIFDISETTNLMKQLRRNTEQVVPLVSLTVAVLWFLEQGFILNIRRRLC